MGSLTQYKKILPLIPENFEMMKKVIVLVLEKMRISLDEQQNVEF